MLFGIGRTCNFGDYKWEIKKFPNLESGEFWLHKEQYQFADRWLFDCEDDAKDFLIEYGIEEKVIKNGLVSQAYIRLSKVNWMRNLVKHTSIK